MLHNTIQCAITVLAYARLRGKKKKRVRFMLPNDGDSTKPSKHTPASLAQKQRKQRTQQKQHPSKPHEFADPITLTVHAPGCEKPQTVSIVSLNQLKQEISTRCGIDTADQFLHCNQKAVTSSSFKSLKSGDAIIADRISDLGV